MYYINKNVYFVLGHINGALYDLNKGDLFQIGRESKDLIQKIINNPSQSLCKQEKEYLESLCNLKLLTKNYVEPHDILDLYEKPKIEFVWIEVTDMCNLKCIHCYDNAGFECNSIMSIDDFKHILDEIEKIGVKKIQIIGGEPFIISNLKEYLDYCLYKFDYIEIFTNGTLIDNDLITYFKINNIRISISVYSNIESEHDKITGSCGSWKKTNQTIKILKENNIKYKVKNVLMNGLEVGTNSSNLYKLSHKRDIVRITGRAKLDLLSDELLRNKLITEHNLANKISKSFVKKCVSGHNCFSKRLYFSVDNNVYPCVMERRISHGSISTNFLDKIIKDEILKMSKDTIEECNKCEFRYCCFDCRADSNGNDINKKPWYCTYYPLKGYWENDIDSFISELKKSNL